MKRLFALRLTAGLVVSGCGLIGGSGGGPLGQVEQVLHLRAVGIRPIGPPGLGIGRAYAVLSRLYGRPTAAGGTLRPTTPASTTIVTTYGRAAKTCSGIEPRIEPRSPIGGVVRIAVPSDRADANRSDAATAPIGCQRPKMSAARAMKPRPLVMPGWNELP